MPSLAVIEPLQAGLRGIGVRPIATQIENNDFGCEWISANLEQVSLYTHFCSCSHVGLLSIFVKKRVPLMNGRGKGVIFSHIV